MQTQSYDLVVIGAGRAARAMPITRADRLSATTTAS